MHLKPRWEKDASLFLIFEALELNFYTNVHKNPGDSIILASLQKPKSTFCEISN